MSADQSKQECTTVEVDSTWRIGEGKQVWTAGLVLQDGRQYIEDDPRLSSGDKRHHAPRRKMLTPDLIAKLKRIS